MILRKPLKDLALTQEELEDLHVVAKKARSTSKFVTVSKVALDNILHDHSKMVERLERLE